MSESDLFQFEWFVDQDGYELIPPPERPDKPKKNATYLTGQLDGWALKRRGGTLRGYRPLQEFPGLFRQFRELDLSPQAAQNFANEFGLLGHPFLDRDMLTPENEVATGSSGWENRIITMKMICDDLDYGLRDTAINHFNSYVLSFCNVIIRNERAKRPSLDVVPTNLMSCLWLQLAGEITDGTRFKKCRVCPSWFPVGPGTGHRETKEFCSSKCRKKQNYALRKEAERKQKEAEQ